jgi:hypothetical protein
LGGAEWDFMSLAEARKTAGRQGHPLLGYYSLAMGARAVLDAFLRVVVVE